MADFGELIFGVKELLALYWFAVLIFWVLLATVGRVVLYIGYGFVMAAQHARKRTDVRPSSPWVVKVDTFIAIPFVALDILINIFVDSVICVDFRPRYVFATITSRLSAYNREDTWKLRKWWAELHNELLDAKDPDGDHIKGEPSTFKWY